MVRDTLWTAPAEHHLMSLRAKRAAGFGVQGGGEGRPGGVWVFGPGDGSAPGTGPEAYRGATPLAGVVDPQTNVLDPGGTYVYPFPPAGHATPAGAILRYVNTGGGGWGDALAARPRARSSATCATGTSRSRAPRATTGSSITGDPDEDPEGLALDLAATERLRAAQTK